ncbi:glycosyltransferase family 4 protein [Mastigocoleus testarum]|uniref:Glycosyl transferase family 1 domain-containing protein n=1 Tax=Mastigocoleus testarum BC008 TaxID=371196 RepID=A0A0V7ZFS0_9CYAN|nr:glycosyltransferase family 4 protein [Mastigocoleus testarum]KST63319.1 hypothetical protein BC008_39235 [Mastigocoleus testarum BC008]
MNRFITIQVGARRNYAVPAILEKAGILEAFYTDLCADAGLGKWLDCYCPDFLKNSDLQRLLNRRVPANLKNKVRTCDGASIKYLLRQKFTKASPVKKHQILSQFVKDFGQAAIQKGLGNSTHVFSMFGEGLDFLEFAKGQGLKTITDIYISPLTHQILQKERESFPDLELKLPDEIIERDYKWFRKLCQFTDAYVVPSEFVQEGLKAFGVDSVRCHIVPSTVRESWLDVNNQPNRGSILFVGTADLRKGIHILGMAAQKLAHHNYEFRVAGGVSDVIRNHPLTQSLKFLGRIPRADIQKEYANADIFVLPSLAEGSAGVTYEALAVGLPIITTKAAGSVVRDGIEGMIISERDPDALADSIEALVENRELRDRVANAAKERAKDYVWDKYAQRILAVLNNL